MQAGIGNGGAFEVQAHEVGGREMFEALVGDFGAGQVEPAKVGGERGEFGQVGVGKPAAGDCGIALEPGVLGGKRGDHDAELIGEICGQRKDLAERFGRNAFGHGRTATELFGEDARNVRRRLQLGDLLV